MDAGAGNFLLGLTFPGGPRLSVSQKWGPSVVFLGNLLKGVIVRCYFIPTALMEGNSLLTRELPRDLGVILLGVLYLVYYT